jgi:hypothetical protein
MFGIFQGKELIKLDKTRWWEIVMTKSLSASLGVNLADA